MITVKLKGGMGNQMFQYAFARSLSIAKKTNLILDKRYLEDRTPLENFVYRNYDLDIFSIDPVFKERPRLLKYQALLMPYISAFFIYADRYLKIKRPKYYLERSFDFDQNYINLSDNVTAEGYFQSFKYFEHIRYIIVDDFSFRNPISENCIALLDEIKSKNSVCINVRRGDFLTDKLLGAKDTSYYDKGAEFIIGKVSNPHIYIFSDDIEWCQGNLKFDAPTTFVTKLYAGEKFRDYFELMINCKYFVIPNSSFGWWAAYLSPYQNKIVISPKLWFNDPGINTDDLIPKDWIRI